MTWWQDTIAAWRWNRAFRKTHSHLKLARGATEKLRLVLGTARSGTSWLVETLAASSTPLRYWHEPFFRYRPRMPFSDGEDHLAIRYEERLSRWHPLVRAYRSLTVPVYDWHQLGLDERDLRRNDPDWKLCVVKEVHSLLATEGVVRHFGVPMIFIVRDPVYVCDSLFHRDGLCSHYARAEGQYVFEASFLGRFLPERKEAVCQAYRRLGAEVNDRRRIIFERVLTLGLMQLMLRRLNAELERTMLLSYEEMCDNPESTFARAAHFLGLRWEQNAQSFLAETMQQRDESYDPHSIYRATSKQRGRPFKFITDAEAKAAYAMLKSAEIDEVLGSNVVAR